MGEGSPYGWDNDNGTQAGRGEHNIGQNKLLCYNIVSKKVIFTVTFKEKIVLIFTSLVLTRHI